MIAKVRRRATSAARVRDGSDILSVLAQPSAPRPAIPSRRARRRTRPRAARRPPSDRKSTRLNSSHAEIYTFPYTTLFRSIGHPQCSCAAFGASAGDSVSESAKAYSSARCATAAFRSEEHTSELQSRRDLHFPLHDALPIYRTSSVFLRSLRRLGRRFRLGEREGVLVRALRDGRLHEVSAAMSRVLLDAQAAG